MTGIDAMLLCLGFLLVTFTLIFVVSEVARRVEARMYKDFNHNWLEEDEDEW